MPPAASPTRPMRSTCSSRAASPTSRSWRRTPPASIGFEISAKRFAVRARYLRDDLQRQIHGRRPRDHRLRVHRARQGRHGQSRRRASPIKGNVAGEALAGEAVLKTANGERRIDGLSLTLGPNTITGNLMLDEAFVPEGALALALAEHRPARGAGARQGRRRDQRHRQLLQGRRRPAGGGRRQGCLDRARRPCRSRMPKSPRSSPTIWLRRSVSGKVKAVSVISGTTSISDVDVSLTRDGAWTGFSGGATVNDIEARASGRLNIAAGATTVELASGVGEDARPHRHARPSRRQSLSRTVRRRSTG